MRVAVFINEGELHHWIIAVDIALNVYDLVSLKVLLYILLKYDECVGEIYFE